MMSGEITHFSHPEHKLKLEHTEVHFKCDGCKELGIGSRFRCSLCDYDLHKHCAHPTPNKSVIYHPFYPKCVFQFLALPPGDLPRYCNACKNYVNGFVYHCRENGYDLHPCCANLPHVLKAGGAYMKLFPEEMCLLCQLCGAKGWAWMYRSECKKYNIDVSCAMKTLIKKCQEI